jgi:hypothetical protein
MKLNLALAAAAAAALAAPVQAQDLAYVPGTYQYRLSTELHQKQEAMGQTSEAHRTASQFITLKLDRQAGDALGFSITVDSSKTESSTPPTPTPDSKLVGKTVTGTVSPQGRVLTFTAPVDSATTEAEFRSLRSFFVRLPANTTRGASVVDTLADTIHTQGLEIQQFVVMTSTVAGDTTIDGQRAVILDRKGTLKMSGAGEQGGNELVLDGTGNVTGKLYVSAAGGLLGGHIENDAQMSVTVPAANMTIPITQTSTSKIERIAGK